MLQVRGINVFYGDIHALRDLSLKVEQEEIVSMVGSNGAGKTTSINALSGLLPVRWGEIVFLEERLTGLSPHRIVERGVVQIPEGRLLFPEMTVLENLEIGAYASRARPHIKQSLQEILSLFPRLGERRHQLAGSLSGGEQQMLAIGRGMMARPKLLMLDEPSLGLAPKLVTEVFSIVKDIHKRGTSILLVEQNVFHALSISNRGYVIENGSVVLEGAGGELLKNKDIEKAYLGL
jgi:branched-chain amino acid transport system ATP-binding protein